MPGQPGQISQDRSARIAWTGLQAGQLNLIGQLGKVKTVQSGQDRWDKSAETVPSR